MSKSQERFMDGLGIQLVFIQNSCDLYDAGCEYEALRIATCISIILLDTSKQTSVLTHLMNEQKEKIALLSTNTSNMKDVHFFDLLSKFDQNGKQVPYLDESSLEYVKPGMMSITEWLNQDVIGLDTVEPNHSHFISRKLIINTARNKDGGAHIDEKLKKPEYISLKNGIEIMKSKSGEIITTAQLHLVALRQIGYEILKSDLLTQIMALKNK